MTASSLLRQLHLKYADLVKRTKEALSPDERRSLRYYVAEMALQEIGASVGRPADRVTEWAANLLELEEFVVRTGRLPRVNRRSGGSMTHAEVRLEQWLNFQTRPSTISRHCTYQTDRLAIIPGYSASRLEDRWQVRYDQYREFLGEQRRVPALRSTDSFEKSCKTAAASPERIAFRTPCRRADTTRNLVLGSFEQESNEIGIPAREEPSEHHRYGRKQEAHRCDERDSS
jgi:hypothetical protein